MDRNKGLSSYTKPSEAEIIFSLNISELNSRGNWSPRGENKLPNFLFFYNLMVCSTQSGKIVVQRKPKPL